MNRLVIRADGGTRIGAGHLMRCLALAEQWRGRGGQVTLISCCENEKIKKRFTHLGIESLFIQKRHPELQDAKFTLATLDRIVKREGTRAIAAVVIDGYHFDSMYQGAIRKAGFRLMCIDDMAHLQLYQADIILNQNIQRPRFIYNCNHDCQLLLGPEYALLRSEFKAYKDWRRSIPDVARKVLVTMGGADPENITLKVIEAAQMLRHLDLELRIIVGPANPRLGCLKEAVAISPKKVQLLFDVTNMAEVMRWADVAISGAGSTCWELAYMGVPFITIEIADNQQRIASSLADSGNALNLGWFSAVGVEDIARCVEKLILDSEKRLDMSQKGRMLVDGNGVDRVIKSIESLA